MRYDLCRFAMAWPENPIRNRTPVMNFTSLALRRCARFSAALLGALLLAACGSRPPAPVVDRSTISPRAADAARTPSASVVRPPATRPPQAAPASRPPAAIAQPLPARSAATSRPGALERAVDEVPLIQIETIRSDTAPIGQAPVRPAAGSASVNDQASAASPPSPVLSPSAPAGSPSATRPPALSPPAASASTVPAPAQPSPPVRDPAPSAAAQAPAASASSRFVWPVRGRLLEAFSDSQNPALYLDGSPGDPVAAAADGRVIFSGQGPKGYGNLIIIRHDDQFLSVYGHNRALLAKEGDQVKQGQTIAELGSSDSDKPRLRFEIRRDGRPVDPAKLLPPK